MKFNKLLIVIILVVAGVILIRMIFNKERFSQSKGGYMITWQPPSNVSGEDVTYNITIRDHSTGQIVDSQSGLTDPQYFFTDGDWTTQYDTSVTVQNAVGVSSPSTVNFTSPQGPYNPTNISDLRVIGFSQNGLSAVQQDPINVGDQLVGLQVSFSTPLGSDPVPFWSTYKSPTTKSSLENGIYSYGIIVYESESTGDKSYYILSMQNNSAVWTYSSSSSRYYSKQMDVSSKENGLCSSGLANPFQYSYVDNKTIGCLTKSQAQQRSAVTNSGGLGFSESQPCQCPLMIQAYDSITVALLFVQPYSGAYSSMTKKQIYAMDVPDAPVNLNFGWEPIAGYSPDELENMSPSEIQTFILNHVEV